LAKITNPVAITAQVATVRHKTSGWAKFQIARILAMTLTMIHRVMTKNAVARTFLAFKNPWCLVTGSG